MSKHEEEGYRFIGTAFEVYNQIGYGMAEEAYQQCLEIELTLRETPFRSKPEMALSYKGKLIEKRYLPDLVVYDSIVVELKAVKELATEHESQLFNYLRISRQTVGYLVNFGKKGDLEWKRFLLSDLHQKKEKEEH